jgi:formate hydrogenlyase subunit 3/multisubunit Na+/H+ antiporter MnhD subunit
MSIPLPVLPVALPLAAGILVLIVPRAMRWVHEAIAALATAATLALAVLLFLRGASEFRLSLLAIGEFSLSLDLAPSALGCFMLLFAAGFGVLIALYSLPAMASSPHRRQFYAFLLLALGGSAGVFLADHLLVFLVCWEIVTASLYFLISTGTPESKAGATKTFAMLGGADGCLLLGIGLLWYAVRTFSIGAIRVPAEGWLLAPAFLLMSAAAVTKAGSLPFHTWLPAASEGAPAAVMAFLPAAVDKLLGIFLLVRLCTGIFVPGPALGMTLMVVGAVTIVAAVLVAMVQHDLMRLLSYHAVSQVGYMVLAIGTLSPVGIAGGLFHMLNNSLYKSCLFLCGGSVARKAGTTDLDELGGLAGAMPATFGAFLVAALAISGVPPLNGFVSKWMIYQGAIIAGGWAPMVFLVAAMFGSALTLASFVKALYAVFLGPPSLRTRAVTGEANILMVAPPVLLALLCVLFGVWYRFPLAVFIVPAAGTPARIFGVWNASLATVLIAVALLAGALVYLFGRMWRKTRLADPFVGGERVPVERLRVSGTRFYDTIKDLPLLRPLYRWQERGVLDPYFLLGRAGAGVTWVLRRIHNGILPWYLAWSLLGILALIAVFTLR